MSNSLFTKFNNISFPKTKHFFNTFIDVFFNHSFISLFIIWFSIFILFFLFFRLSYHLTFLAMSDVDRQDCLFEQGKDKKIRKNLFKAIQFDQPFFSLLCIRQVGVLFTYFIRFFLVFIVGISIVIIVLTWFKVSLLFNYKYPYYYLFYFSNNYGIIAIGLGLFFSLIAYLIIYHRYMKSWFGEIDKTYNEMAIKDRKQSSLRSGELLDVKNLDFNTTTTYDPTLYFEQAKNKNALFLGLNDLNEPLFFSKTKWNETNVQVMGKMGSGKGVLSTNVLVQCYKLYNDLNIIFDPKNDEWAYHVFKQYTNEEDFYYIDLNRGQPPQLNIFADITSYELNELLVAGFGLGSKGTDADFYRMGDRKISLELSKKFKNGTNILSLYNELLEMKKDKELENVGNNFALLLAELKELEVIQTEKGLNLKEIINNERGGTIYITGSLRDENVVMLQKMLFLRCVQIIEKRNRIIGELKHVNIFLDEVKYLLSKSTLEAMGTIRDKKANIIYTHQSLGDLASGGKDLDGKATQTVMLDGVNLRWIYKLDVYDSAKWASDLTGETLKDVERRTLTLNQSNVEMAGKETTIFKQKANYIETSVIQNLPNRCGVLIGLEGLPQLAYSSPIIVEKSEKKVKSFNKLSDKDAKKLQFKVESKSIDDIKKMLGDTEDDNDKKVNRPSQNLSELVVQEVFENIGVNNDIILNDHFHNDNLHNGHHQ